jgi:thermitase
MSMKKIILSFTIATFALLGCTHSIAKDDYVPGEVLLKFKDYVTDERAAEIIGEQDAVIIRHIHKIGVYHLRLKKGQSVRDAMRALTEYEEVEYVEPNYLRKAE